MDSREYFDCVANNWDVLAGEEHIMQLQELVDALPIEEESTILDVGSGTGVLIPLLLKKIKGKGVLIAIDSSRNMLLKARAKAYGDNVGFIQADVHALPIKKGLCNLVICYSSFPHFNNKALALSEMARVLKKGGTLIINHTASMQEINSLHRKIGGAVKNHTIPKEHEVRKMLHNTGLAEIEIWNKPDSYIVSARKLNGFS